MLNTNLKEKCDSQVTLHKSKNDECHVWKAWCLLVVMATIMLCSSIAKANSFIIVSLLHRYGALYVWKRKQQHLSSYMQLWYAVVHCMVENMFILTFSSRLCIMIAYIRVCSNIIKIFNCYCIVTVALIICFTTWFKEKKKHD